MVEVMKVPDAIALEARLEAATLAEVAALAVAALRASPLPPIKRWSIPATARRKPVSPGKLPDELTADRLPPSVNTATLELGDGSLGSLFHPYGESLWAFTLDALVPKNAPESLPTLLAAQRSVARVLLNDPRVERVTVSMQSAGAYCLPEVPIALTRTYLVSTTEKEVANAYDDPEAFWQSGWEATEWIGEHVLLERAMHTSNTTDYLKVVIPHQWELVRAARAGQCKYGIPAVLPTEKDVYFSGAPALQVVGYEDRSGTVELSCPFRPPKHIQGWEIFNLYGLLQSGKLQDGRPVREAQVVFLYEEMARTERRPLRDIGIKVLFYDDNGQLHEILNL